MSFSQATDAQHIEVADTSMSTIGTTKDEEKYQNNSNTKYYWHRGPYLLTNSCWCTFCIRHITTENFKLHTTKSLSPNLLSCHVLVKWMTASKLQRTAHFSLRRRSISQASNKDNYQSKSWGLHTGLALNTVLENSCINSMHVVIKWTKHESKTNNSYWNGCYCTFIGSPFCVSIITKPVPCNIYQGLVFPTFLGLSFALTLLTIYMNQSRDTDEDFLLHWISQLNPISCVYWRIYGNTLSETSSKKTARVL